MLNLPPVGCLPPSSADEAAFGFADIAVELLVSEQTCEQPRPARLGRAPLIPIRQSVRRPSGEHASSVCVASPGGVALREDQHVLAQCGQMVPAERAAVRGGLQVLSRAHSPPARVCLALVAHAYIRSAPPCSRIGMHRQAGLPKIPSERSRGWPRKRGSASSSRPLPSRLGRKKPRQRGRTTDSKPSPRRSHHRAKFSAAAWSWNTL